MTDSSDAHTFGDGAAEMSNESEVEAPLEGGASAPAADAVGEEIDADLATAEADVTKAQQDVAALTADLQRLQAEYLNYKRRVDRDRQLVAENAAYKALLPIIEVLDAVDRAREAGEVDGGFKVITEQLERAVGQSGLVRFGQPGDPFDPNIHEALSHLGEDPSVPVTSVKVVAKGGYRIGDRLVRAAQVLVVDPSSAAQEQAPGSAGEASPEAHASDTPRD